MRGREVLQEKDCHQLGNAGHVARQKGILARGQSLTCPHIGCDRINCKLLDDPLVRTIYVASAEIPTVTPKERFYKRIEKHFKKTGASG
jgi:hypothetical protein